MPKRIVAIFSHNASVHKTAGNMNNACFVCGDLVFNVFDREVQSIYYALH